VNYILTAHGIHPAEVSVVGIGVAASAIAAIESGRVDAAGSSGGDHILVIRRNPAARILADDSTSEGMRETFGGDVFASGALAAKQDWLDRNPDVARRLGRALQHTLHWIAMNTDEEIRGRMPASFRSQDAAVDIEMIRWGRSAYTTDGAMPKGGPEAVKHFLDATIDKVRDSKIDLAATWTNEFLSGPK
jgi:NitT/TauT family transport system substrate-binding protein